MMQPKTGWSQLRKLSRTGADQPRRLSGLPLEFMTGLGYTPVIEFAEPVARLSRCSFEAKTDRRDSALDRKAALHFVKIQTISIVTAASILLVGCGKQSSSSSTVSPPANEQSSTASAAVPITQPAMTAWQQGDKSTAVSQFLAADWSARPLFPASSVLSLSEDQFKALSVTEEQAKSGQMMSQLDSLKALARAVIQAGDDAVAKGDTAEARKHFTSVEQCGAALDSTNCLKLVQLVGQAFEKRAQAELAKIGQ